MVGYALRARFDRLDNDIRFRVVDRRLDADGTEAGRRFAMQYGLLDSLETLP